MARAPSPFALASWPAAAAVALFCSGCPPGGGTDAGACTFAFEWGSEASGAFVPYADGSTAEITLGFQGFLFIYSAARLSGVEAGEATFTFQVEVDGTEPFVSYAGASTLAPDASGGLFADEVLLFFNDQQLAQLLGRTARIDVLAAAAGCSARKVLTVTLVDEEACVAPPDGGNTCSDAGTAI